MFNKNDDYETKTRREHARSGGHPASRTSDWLAGTQVHNDMSTQNRTAATAHSMARTRTAVR